MASSSSSSLNRIADTGLTRFPSIRSEGNDGTAWRKKAVDKNVPRIGRPISNVCPKWRSNPLPPFPSSRLVHYVRIHESVTLSLTKLAFTYASSIVRLGLEVPRAFWNDVVGRGRFEPGAARIRQTDTERLASLYIGPRQLPHYSRWPMANRIGQVPQL